MHMTFVLTFALGGVSRYLLNAFTPRVVSTAVNEANRCLVSLGSGYGKGFIHHQDRLKQRLGPCPLLSISWVGAYRGGKTTKAVEKFQGRAAHTSSSTEFRTKDSKVSLVVVSDDGTYMYVCGMHCSRFSRWVARGCEYHFSQLPPSRNNIVLVIVVVSDGRL